MRWTDLLRAADVALLAVVLAGCARDRAIESTQTPSSEPPIPLRLQGSDTQLRLRFPSGRQSIEPGQFEKSEICYLMAGGLRINCYTDGSSLSFGGNDTATLLADNPMWAVQPADGRKSSTDYMRLYGILFLVGGSIEQLPQVLSDYIEDPGTHKEQAISLAQLLLNSKPVEFRGFARGGTFVASVQLTDAGQDKLLEALDEVGEPTGVTQFALAHPRVSHK